VAAPVLAWLRFDALVGLRRWDELEAEIDRTTPLFASLGSLVRAHRHHAAAARLAAERGEGAAVEVRIEAARAGLRASAYAFEEANVLVDLAQAAWRAGLVRLSRDLVQEAMEAADRASAPWARARAELVGATVWAGSRRGDELLGACLERSAAAAGGLVELWARRERPLAGVLLARALAAGLGPPGTAAELARACGGEVFRDCVLLLRGAGPEARAELAEVAADAAGVDADTVGRLLRDRDSRVRSAARRARAQLEARPRPALRLATLGGFTVWLGGLPVPDSAFGRQKARALLALLLCAGGPVHREAIVEWLWSQLAPPRGLAALHSTLYALRRAIEPGLARGAVSSLVVTEGETYRLALGEADSWDAAEFLELAGSAARGGARGRLERLAAAEAAYTGQLLPEWPYERWADARRGEVEDGYRDVLERLAEELVAEGRPDAAAPRYRRLLGLDPEREGWHRALMRVYAQAGERALALRQYHLCRAILRRELGVEPSLETRTLYAELLSGETGGLAAVR
jgi:DNA-binding SARP family transcriptional activator